MFHHPHHEKHTPSFCKRYSQLGGQINDALLAYRDEVISGEFPSEQYSPYKVG